VTESTVDTRLMKALAHPLRQRLLIALSERVASPSELAEELGEPLGNVSYHVRMLVDLECIELVGTTPRRGALEHHYKAVVRPIFDDATYATFPSPTKRALMGDILKEIWQDVGAAADAGTFDDNQAHVSRSPLRLDAKGWEDLSQLLAETVDRAQEIKSQSAARLGKGGGGEAIQSVFAMMHFRAAPGGRGRGKAAAKRTRKSSSKR
jgi:DNA-binding transcriptional ArsR family regulator